MRTSRPLALLCTALLLSVACSIQLNGAAAVSVDLSDTVQRNHVFLFGDYGSPTQPMSDFSRGAASPSSTARYVQLSNGSRFVCETTAFEHHDPPPPPSVPLSFIMQSVIKSIKDAGLPCTHVVDEQHSLVVCWDREVRRDAVQAQTTQILGRRTPAEATTAEYWTSHDSFGPYVATVYGGGEECRYAKRPTETELRFYCRYTELENPLPFLTLYEASQCHFVVRVMSNRFCHVPQLDHAIETETVQCRMLD